jgi:hypothetical protein
MCSPPVDPQIWKENDDETLNMDGRGCLSPLVVVTPNFFHPKCTRPQVYPPCGLVFTSASANHDHTQIYFPFVSPFQYPLSLLSK